MKTEKRRSLKEGIGFGILAGILFAVVEMIAAAAMGNPAIMPFRMFASIVGGQGAMQAMAAGTAIVLGTVVHLVLSGAFGAIYGSIAGGLKSETQTMWNRQASIGLLFGAALWFVNFQIIARILYPWFLEAPQLLQLVMHMVFFGLPLALLYAGAERRVRGVAHA